MPVAKEKSKQLPQVKLKEASKDIPETKIDQKENAKLEDIKRNNTQLIARADYRTEGWFAVVYDENSHEAVFAELAASEASAYEAAIAEIKRIHISAEGFAAADETAGKS